MGSRFFVNFLAAALLFSVSAAAQEIDTSELTEEQKAQLIFQAAQMKKQNQQFGVSVPQEELTVERASDYLELGKNTVLTFIAVADKFLESNTGKIVLLLITREIVGINIFNVIGGTIAWIVLIKIVIWSFRHFHMREKVKVKTANGYDYKILEPYNFTGRDVKFGSAVAHIIVFFAVTIVCLTIIFT